MKLLIFILFNFIAISIFSQDFAFKNFDPQKLQADVKSKVEFVEPIYLYLTQNYDSLGAKFDLKTDEYEADYVCSFKQKFGSDILFEINSCGEGGSGIDIAIPKTENKFITTWIEDIYKSSATELINVWNEQMTKYYPEDEGAGCYYEIKQEENRTVITTFCGC